MPQTGDDSNDFRPQRSDSGASGAPRIFAFVKPELEVAIDEREMDETEDDDKALVPVCRCDKVCTCNTVRTGKVTCRCNTVTNCTCESVKTCTCNSVAVCGCDTVPVCTCNPQCSCDSYSPGGGGSRVCRCVPVAH